ncbi:hypothetical protein SAMN05444007_108237 [Cribrihabitans marinus]|uniref:DNA primase/helicase n=1 Tax=Cribrihabitans marinus TaxID=1227549 RepID=A0A1H7CPG1_9RHOB|nr:hypothetical protein [Cribrihabitans marinus]GGH36215.1 hypothetical protein GCM10010973_30050 [Cribrihabitans marinus]SEJ91346.1 hypothetical protein SAMN05444007_108237 [Cribrihabitans marinus]
MSEPNNDDWLPDPEPRPIDEEALRRNLADAPVVPGEVSEKKKGKDDGPRKAGSRTAKADRSSQGSDGGRGRGSRKRGEIFDDCPVTPLGVHGDYAYFLDVSSQIRAVKKLEGQVIQSLFGHALPQLRHHFPVWKKSGDDFVRDHKRFDQTHASMVMWEAVTECGVLNPKGAVRGVGAWTDDDGQLIYHLGDAVLVGGELQKPGRIGKKIYPALPPMPHPSDDPGPDPVPEILDTLESWNWRQPDLHPFLTLGMICVMMLCGALDWRPVFWMLAPAGAGKSEFQKLLGFLLDDGGVIQTTDTTKSGITSQLGQSSLPVSVDELEPGDERSTKERDMIALARVAASGGEWLRGSSDQSGVGGKVFSAFLFSSILIPGVMKTQDVQRLIRLELEPLPEGTAGLKLQPRTWRDRGARLRRRLIDRWAGWPERYSAWRQSLELAGVTGRNADNWTPVLALADMAIGEDIAGETARAGWARKAAFQVTADRDDTTNDSEAMLLYLLSHHYDPWRRGEQWTVAQWVMAAAGLPGAPDALRDHLSDASAIDDRTGRMGRANALLAKIGLRVVHNDPPSLFICNAQIQGLKDLFRNSDWAGGVWKQSAGRVPGASLTPNPLTLAGIRSRGTLMPLKSIPGLMTFPMDREAPAAGAPSDEIEDFM